MKKIIKTLMMAVACGGLFPAAATAQSYNRVTNIDDLESGKQYLIVAESDNKYYAWKGLDGSYGKSNENPVTADELFETAKPVILVKTAGGWNIYDTDSKQYVGAKSASSENLEGLSIPTFDRCLWTISIEEAGTATVKNHEYNSRYLRFYYSSLGNKLFRTYGESENNAIYLYKEKAGTSLTLFNEIDNTSTIADASGKTFDTVTLQNRTLIKDGKWNTLCLPFALSKEQIGQSVLAGATIMEIDIDGTYKETATDKWNKADDGTQKTGFKASNGTLYLFFKTAESIVAGTPYIIKWEDTSGTIDSPAFNSVTIVSTVGGKLPTPVVEVKNSGLSTVQFIGTYGPDALDANDQSKFFLGSANTLYYPSTAMSVNAFRAYFHVDLSGQANVRAFSLNIGDNDGSAGDPAGIHAVETGKGIHTPNGWFTLDGRRLEGKPAQRGLYINNGRKVVIN